MSVVSLVTLLSALQGSKFFSWRLAHYGQVYKTHLLGSPTVRVVGAENVQRVLMGEHVTVCSNWPWSVRRLMGPNSLLGMSSDDHRVVKSAISALFTPEVLASFVPRIQVGQSLVVSVCVCVCVCVCKLGCGKRKPLPWQKSVDILPMLLTGIN